KSQLEELGIKIGLTEDDTGNLKLVLNDGTGSTTLAKIDEQASDAKLAIDDDTTSMDIISTKKILPNDFSQINFTELAKGLDTSLQKVDLLSEALKGTADNILSVDKKAQEFLDKVNNIATTMDTVMNNTGSFSAIRGEVQKLIEELLTAQEKMGGIFNGLNIDTSIITKPIKTIKDAVEGIGDSVEEVKDKVPSLATSLSTLSNVPTGNINEYVHQLALLCGNLVLASQYGKQTADSQGAVISAFTRVVDIIKSYNSSISSAGSGVEQAFAQMASSIMAYTTLMITQYARNALGIELLRELARRHLKEMVDDFSKAGKNSSDAMKNMTNLMHKEFKSGMDDIVTLAGGVPARIGEAIRRNMAQASSAMDAVAKDMVSRFKKELGIHSPSRVFEDLGGWVIKGLA